MPNFTTDDLLLYLYSELNTTQTTLLEASLKKDWALQQKLEILKESFNLLESTPIKSPRTKTIKALLTYAEKAMVTEKQ